MKNDFHSLHGLADGGFIQDVGLQELNLSRKMRQVFPFASAQIVEDAYLVPTLHQCGSDM